MAPNTGASKALSAVLMLCANNSLNTDVCAGVGVLVACIDFGLNPALALILRALTASVFVALCVCAFVRLCVCAAFLVWPLWLTGESSRFAFGERLTFVC